MMSRIGRGRCSAQNQEMVKFTPQTEDWPPLSGAGGGQGYQGFRRYTAIISSPEKCLLGSRRPHAQIILQSTGCLQSPQLFNWKNFSTVSERYWLTSCGAVLAGALNQGVPLGPFIP